MTKFQDLNLNNAFLFATVAQDPEACRAILQIVLEREVPQVHVFTEHEMLISSEYRMIRLDVYGEDELDVQYNIEMQNRNRGNLPKRSRYHHAKMDVKSLKPGMDFEQLNPSYVIFICTFDPFGQGLYRYTFTQRCAEADISLGDETCTIFFNTKGKNAEKISDELKDFLAYIENSSDEFVQGSSTSGVKLLHEKVRQIKKNAELEAKYMTVEEWVQDMSEELAEELAEERAQELAEQAKIRGMAEGIAQSILVVLTAKFDLPDELREKILCQENVSVLDEWLLHAANATSMEDFNDKISQ